MIAASSPKPQKMKGDVMSSFKSRLIPLQAGHRDNGMAFWSRKKTKEASFRSWNLPGEIGTVSLPEFLKVEMEDDQTLLAALPDDLVVIRCSSISITKKGESVNDIAKNYIRQKAGEDGQPYYEVADKGILSYEEQSEQNSQQLIIKYWKVGVKSTLVVISATVLSVKINDGSVQSLLSLIPRIAESVTINKTHKIVSYDGVDVSVIEEKVEPKKQEISSFGPVENAWLEQGRRVASSLGVRYGSGGALTPEELDMILSRWTFDEDEKESGESVAHALGAAFGDYFVEDYGFRWVMVTDQYGYEYAVRHRIGETMAFPRSSVEKRIEKHEPECFQSLRAAILQLLKECDEEKSN